MRDLLLRVFSKICIGLFGSRTVRASASLFRIETAGRVWFCRLRPIFVRNRGWFRSEEKTAGDVTAFSIFAFWLPTEAAADSSYSPTTDEVLCLALSEPLQNFCVPVPGEPALHWRSVYNMVEVEGEPRVREFWRLLKQRVGTRYSHDDFEFTALSPTRLAPLFEHERRLVNEIAGKKWTPHPTLESASV